jgi:hypothetical protein
MSELTPKQLFQAMLLSMAKMTNTALDETIVMLYDQELAPLGYDKVTVAMRKMFADLNSRKPLPSINEIKAQMSDKPLDPKLRAHEVAMRIHGRVMNCHTTDPVCEIGEEVVRRHGGWSRMNFDLKAVPFEFRKWEATALAILENPSFKEGQQFIPIEGKTKEVLDKLFLDMPTTSTKPHLGRDETTKGWERTREERKSTTRDFRAFMKSLIKKDNDDVEKTPAED